MAAMAYGTSWLQSRNLQSKKWKDVKGGLAEFCGVKLMKR
jgi:hypothetical protein